MVLVNVEIRARHTRPYLSAYAHNEGINTMIKKSSYQVITDTIITEMEKGKIPWRKPWASFGNPQNAISKKDYRGINAILLGITPYQDPRWLTYKQAKSLKGSVKKGEKSTKICYFKMLESKDETLSNGKIKTFPFLKMYSVFNVEQCDGLDLAPLGTLERDVSEIPSANEVVNGYADPQSISWTANAAFYNPSRDAISMPQKEAFESDDLRMGTLFHELIHSTGHESRLNRLTLMKNNRFGSERYSKEELIAELGSAFLISHTNITPNFKDHAGYIQGWIKVLKNDPKAIVHAASKAQKAVEHILGQ